MRQIPGTNIQICWPWHPTNRWSYYMLQKHLINFRFSQATYGNIWEFSHVFAYSQRQASAILRPCEEDIAHATQAQYLSMSRGLSRNFVPRPWCHPQGPMAPWWPHVIQVWNILTMKTQKSKNCKFRWSLSRRIKRRIYIWLENWLAT